MFIYDVGAPTALARYVHALFFGVKIYYCFRAHTILYQ